VEVTANRLAKNQVSRLQSFRVSWRFVFEALKLETLKVQFLGRQASKVAWFQSFKLSFLKP